MTSRQRAVWLLAEEDVAVATAMHVFLTALLAAKHRAGFGFAYAQKMHTTSGSRMAVEWFSRLGGPGVCWQFDGLSSAAEGAVV